MYTLLGVPVNLSLLDLADESLKRGAGWGAGQVLENERSARMCGAQMA